MKFILIFLLILGLYSNLYAAIDERKIDVYFANGIDTKKGIARNNALLIEENIAFIYGGYTQTFYQEIGDVYTAYNKTNGAVLDAWEFIAQKLNFQDLINAIFDTDHKKDIDTQVIAYKKSINNGHRVLTVAHSQGNLFTAEALNELDGWMQDYFYAVSVASPKAFKIKSNTPHIAFSNDIVPYLGGVFIPIDNPNGQAGSIESHAFTYYMGLPSVVSNVSTDVAKNQIMSAIGGGILNLAGLDSQWNVKLKLTCNGSSTATHISIPKAIEDIGNVYVDKQFGKLYNDGIGYVKADGDENISRVSHNIPSAKSGIIEVTLTWDDVAINMNLKSSLGVKDISGGCEPLEHYFVATEDDVSVGIYPVSISQSGNIKESDIPQNVNLSIHTPGEAMVFDFDITAKDMLNIGHVANIIISEDKEIEFVYTPNNNNNTGSSQPTVTHYGGSSSSSSDSNVSYAKYIYEVQSKLKQATLGPLSDAKIELFDAIDFQYNMPFYESSTSGGTSLLTSGIFYFPSTVLNSLEDEKIYVLTVSGGNDIDANDDGVLDSILTKNNGSIHAIVSGNRLKNENFKVNIVTEVIYQVSKEMISSAEHNTTTINEHLDEMAKRLLIQDLNDDEVIDYNDALVWLPIFDKDKLRKSYNIHYQPVVEKIHNNEDIYDKAYALIYEPILRVQRLNVLEDAVEGDVIGKINIDFYDGDASYTLSGNNSNFFEIAQDGTVTLNHTANIDYDETVRAYIFNISADIDSQTFSTMLTISIYHIPYVQSFSANVDENSAKGAIIGNLEISLGYSPITSMSLSGVGSDDFIIDSNGLISLENEVSFDYERQQDYNLSVVAHTDSGDSEAQTINIAVINSLDAPTYLDFSGETREDSSFGAIIGQIPSLALKDTMPTSIELFGEDSEYFSVDITGVIKLANIQLDYESKHLYTLQAKAFTKYGDSNKVNVIIEIIDVDEYAEAGLGRWGDATVNIYKLEDNATRTLMFSEITSVGADVNSTGLFNSHRLELEEDSFYIYEVSEGEDYDANNDGVIDVIPTPNNGTIHAVIKGSWVRHINWRPRVNLMTEVYYQFVKSEIDTFNVAILEQKLLHKTYGLRLNKNLNANNYSYNGNAIDALIYDPIYHINAWNPTFFPERSLEYLRSKIYENNPAYSLFISNSFINSSYIQSLDIALLDDKSKFFSVGDRNGLRLIDISDLNNPVIIDILPLANYEYMHLIAISSDNKRLYIKFSGVDEWFLKIIDISDILNPVEISKISVPYFSNMQLSKDETKLYVTFSGFNNGLKVIDISNITQPIIRSEINTIGVATNFILSKDEQTAYLADARGGLQIIDISDSDDFKLLGTYITNGLVEKVLLSNDGTKAYLSVTYLREAHFYVIDITDKNNPTLLAEFDLNSFPLTAFTFSSDETKLFVKPTHGSIFGNFYKIYENVGYYEEMNLLGGTSLSTSFSYELILLEGETMMLGVSLSRIDIIDISDPTNPAIIKTTWW